jgi:hypothetical protein
MPSAPAPWDAVELPKDQASPIAAELSPDGKVLALLFSDGNKLAVVEQEQAPGWKFVTEVDLLPQERLPLVRDLAFSSDGETLWVVSGDNEKSLPALQPTRLSAVRLLVGNESAPTASAPAANPAAPPAAPTKHGARLLSLWRTQSVPGAAAPLHVAVARGQPLASGTTIRMPPEKAAVFVTSLNDALFKLGKLDLATPAGAKASFELMRGPNPGILVRADVAGGGGPLFTAPQILSAIDISPDAQLIAATAARVVAPSTGEGVVLEFGVAWAPVWGTPSPTFVSLTPLSTAALKPPFALGELRIQP